MLLCMDFKRDVTPPTTDSGQPHSRPAPVPFDDMMGSLPPTRPMFQAPEQRPEPMPQAPVPTPAPLDDIMGSLPPTRPLNYVPQEPTQTPVNMSPATQKKAKKGLGFLRNRWVLPSIIGVVAVIAIILAGYLSYSHEHKQVVGLDNQVVIFNKHISDQQGEITLLEETVPTLTPSATSYEGWTNYTLKYEKLSFMYPKTWKLVDTSANGSDNVSITSLNNFVITINSGVTVSNPATPVKVIGITPVDFAGKFAYFDLASTANDGLVEEATLSKSPTNALDDFPSKAVGSGSGATNFSLTAAYSSSGDNTGESESLINATKDASFQTAELLIDSMSY